MDRSLVRHEAKGPLRVPRVRRLAPAGGPAEHQADHAADRVLRNQAPPCACGGGCPTCTAAPVARLGGGRPLDHATRGWFEPRFGRDLGAVRVHEGPDAARSAGMLGARAYTIGADIVFARDRYQPHSAAGRGLLAHELAHVALHGQSDDTVFRSEEETPPSAAEVERLYVEMQKLAARNAWAGVARSYAAIEAMGPEAVALARDPAGLYLLGAGAARNSGDSRRYLTLLQRARTSLAGVTGDEAAARLESIEQAIAGVESAYGTVRIGPRSEPKSDRKRAKLTGPSLVREVMPFAADERRSIEAAAAVLAESGYFSGMIPAGPYLLDGQPIVVISGTDNSFLWGN